MSAKLKKPPVFYTLGIINFNAVLEMQEFITKIQSDLRHDFPDFSKDFTHEVQIQMLGPGKSPTVNTLLTERWNFKNATMTAGFSVTPKSVLFHTTEYEDSAAFIKSMIHGLAVVHARVGLAFIESVAIRVLDAVIPSPNEDLSLYLEAGALGLRGIMDGKLQQAVSQATFDTPAGQATSRAVLLNGKLGFPNDLLPMTLKLNKRFNVGKLHAILDNQCQKVERAPIDFPKIESHIKAVKSQTKQAFERSVTKKAIEIWS